MTRRDHYLQHFNDVFSDDCGGLLLNLPEWVRVGIGRRIQGGAITFASAVCPDYEHDGTTFTYRGLGDRLPFIAMRHLEVMEPVINRLKSRGVTADYHLLLADLEADLPMIVEYLAGGSPEEFIRRCQKSCDALRAEAFRREVPLARCERFSTAFPEWATLYGQTLDRIREEVRSNRTLTTELETVAAKRNPYYRSQAGWRPLSTEDCLGLALRHSAQYSTWGECVTRLCGEDVVVINHATINLARVNDPHFRRGRERIPIVQLNINTAPASVPPA